MKRPALAAILAALAAGCHLDRTLPIVPPRDVSSGTTQVIQPETEPPEPSLPPPPPWTFAPDRPRIQGVHVHLRVPHLRQGHNLCVPTAAAMATAFFGESLDPVRLKALSGGDPSFDGTFYKDMIQGMSTLRYEWLMVRYDENAAGFARGMRAIELSLDEGRPVIVSLYSRPIGHTNLAVGYDRDEQAILLLDPDKPPPGIVPLRYVAFEKRWHETMGRGRWVIFTGPKR